MIKNLRRFSAYAFFVLALLNASFAVQAQDTDAIKQAAKDAKVSTDLLTVITNGGIKQEAPVAGLQRINSFVVSGNSIAIEAVANSEGEGQALLQALQALGLTQGVALKHRVSGFLPIDKLDELKDVSSLKYADASYQPMHNVGAVTTQGDVALRADVARTTYSVDGTGVKVGILSDSYDNKGGAAAGVMSGDLPAGVQVLKDLAGTGGSDEGRGMAELIHDVAPGSPLAFYTAFVSQTDFAAGIRALATAGCKVITDDVFYFAEPFFQDGVIAQAVDDVVNNSGVSYFSSAGNNARTSYQSTYNPITSASLPSGYTNAHNFGGGDIFQSFTIAAGRTIRIGFQWDDPFNSVSSGTGAQTDMDFLVYFGGAYQAGLSSIANNIGGDPFEFIGLTNNGSTAVVIDLVLAKKSGPNPNLVKWIYYGNGLTAAYEYDTKSSTNFGHSGSSRAIAVGAAAFYDTPAFNGAATATIEGFSSAGGTPTLFNTNGTRINGSIGITRQKPEITSVDGGNTTFFGTDTSRDTDTFPNFFGTSAAAPHAAAVAALMKQKVPTITRDAILTAMENTALDMDDPFTAGFDTGFDFGTGYGFIQADRALQAITLTPLALTLTATPTMLLTTGTTKLSATVSGGTTPYSYTFSGPGTITQTPNSNTASVSNIPAGVQTFTVVARDATTPTSQSITGTVSVTVTTAPPANTPPVATANANQTATVGVPFSYTVNAFTDAETPTMLTYSASIVPPNNLSFNAGTRVISGTPSMSGVSSVTVTASDPGSLSAATTFTITVSPAPVTPPPTTGPFSITGVTTVSCATVSAGLRTLTFNPQYSGLNGSPVSFSVANEMLPTTAPGPYSLNLYIDNPVITLQAMQSGVSSSFVYNWLVACGGGTPPPPPPTTGTFSITGVTTVSCATVSAGERTLTFNPRYAGLDGSPVSFSVVNELLPTTAPGPYSLRVYTDNPVITLQAMQSGVSSSFAYNWLNACNGGSPGSARLGSEPVARLQATLLPNPVGSEFGVRIEGAQGQSVRLELSDLSGHSVLSRLVDVVSDSHQERLRFGQSGVGLYLLRVSTAQQALTLKVIRE